MPLAKPVTAVAVPAPCSLVQEPFVIAAGAIRACEVPIRTVATSVLNSVSLIRRPFSADTYFYFT